MSVNAGSSHASAMKSVIISFMRRATREPHKDTTSGLSAGSPRYALASACVQSENAPRTGVPVTSTFFTSA